MSWWNAYYKLGGSVMCACEGLGCGCTTPVISLGCGSSWSLEARTAQKHIASCFWLKKHIWNHRPDLFPFMQSHVTHPRLWYARLKKATDPKPLEQLFSVSNGSVYFRKIWANPSSENWVVSAASICQPQPISPLELLQVDFAQTAEALDGDCCRTIDKCD